MKNNFTLIKQLLMGCCMLAFTLSSYAKTTTFAPDSASVIYGCMDPKATNFNPSATVNYGCQYSDTTKVFGCMDPKASNFNPSATVNYGCQYSDTSKVFGCMDPKASNYDSSANAPAQCYYYNDT
ncbi:MAG: hypothetical protein RL711_837, partial [Bacteroidota bacterium]